MEKTTIYLRYLTSLVTFTFNEIVHLDAKGFIMQGFAEMSKRPVPGSKHRSEPNHVQIEYNFRTQEFREVTCCVNGTTRRKGILYPILAEDIGANNKDIANKLIAHMSNCMCSIEQ